MYNNNPIANYRSACPKGIHSKAGPASDFQEAFSAGIVLGWCSGQGCEQTWPQDGVTCSNILAACTCVQCSLAQDIDQSSTQEWRQISEAHAGIPSEILQQDSSASLEVCGVSADLISFPLLKPCSNYALINLGSCPQYSLYN